MVLLVAHANFQDRLILALNLPLEAEGPAPAPNVRFARVPLGASRAGPAREKTAATGAALPRPRLPDSDWQALDFGRIQRELAARRGRKPRIDISSETSGAIFWGLVCNRYQPELAAAWTACAQAFGDEANQDPVFEQYLLWVVSRSSGCFYCLGHTEMMLEVAGLKPGAIAERTQCLASGDWSGFSPAERDRLSVRARPKNLPR